MDTLSVETTKRGAWLAPAPLTTGKWFCFLAGYFNQGILQLPINVFEEFENVYDLSDLLGGLLLMTS